MKPFIRSLIFFLIPIIGLSLSLEYYLRNRINTNEILAKLELVHRHSDTELIFIGNSHGRNSFNPDDFELKSLNLCIGGSTPFYNSELLEKVIDDFPNLKYIVYNISYQSLFYDMDRLPDEKKKYEFLHYLGSDCGVDKNRHEYYSILSTVGLRNAIDNVIVDLTQSSEKWIEHRGFKSESGKIDLDDVREAAHIRIDAHHQLMSDDKKTFNFNQLSQTEKIAEEHSVKIIYVALPVIEAYANLMESPFVGFRKEMNEFVNSRGSSFIDLSIDPQLDLADFVDPDHVNIEGAQKLSDFLSDRLDSLKNAIKK
ncbi:MAG: hypothetical protein AAGA77_00615 [Bacteroidota bacterium]